MIATLDKMLDESVLYVPKVGTSSGKTVWITQLSFHPPEKTHVIESFQVRLSSTPVLTRKTLCEHTLKSEAAEEFKRIVQRTRDASPHVLFDLNKLDDKTLCKYGYIVEELHSFSELVSPAVDRMFAVVLKRISQRSRVALKRLSS